MKNNNSPPLLMKKEPDVVTHIQPFIALLQAGCFLSRTNSRTQNITKL